MGLLRTDASCICLMGYLLIYFCVLSSVLLAFFEVLPLRRMQVGRKSWVLRPTCVLRFLRRNCTRYFSRQNSTKIHCNQTPRAVVALSRYPLPSRAAPSRRRRIYVNPRMRTISLCVMRLPICEFFCVTPRTHTGTPRMHTGTSF